MKSIWWEHQTAYTNELNADETCDVAIVGGGIVGISAAYHLSRRGLNVVLCEAQSLGEGSTGFSSAFLANSTTLDLADLVETYGDTKAKKIYDSIAHSIAEMERVIEAERIACDFRRSDSLYFAEEEAQLPILQKEFEVKKRLGYSAELLDGNDSSIPIAGATGAIRNHNEASMNPIAFLLGVARACVRNGVRIYTGAKITSVQEDAHGVLLKTACGNTVRAKHVVNAVSIWPSGRVVNHSLETYAAPLTSYILVTKPVPGLSQRWHGELMWNAYEAYQYMRLLPDDRVIIGGEDEFFGNPSGHATSAVHTSQSERLIRKLESYFPGIHFKIQAAWSGYLAYPLDGLPVVQTHGRMVSAVTDGLPFGWLVGIVAADRITKGHSEYDELFDCARDFGFLRNLYIKAPVPFFIKRWLLRIVAKYESGT